MTDLARTCCSCRVLLADWPFETCVGCLLRAALAAPLQRPEAIEQDQDQIGPYTIVRRISSGGMGVVYEAESAALARRVAIKVIREDLDGRAVLRRFQHEMDTLAAMEHPNIARIYDAGSLPDGRPYFVMEFVDGEPISEYCRTRRLRLRQRLELFLQACAAVQHAHQRAVIHRDLTPSNVLVTTVDGQPSIKLIDFGVAKAVGDSVLALAQTRVGEVVGTPEYMSPEQTVPGAEFDTRSDVYSLGALLYELLVDARPFADRNLGRLPAGEIFRIIREVDPPPPSRRLPVGASEVRAALGQDLDWITLKALEKDKSHRYASVKELADDVLRFLRHVPVAARPPSLVYRTRKFARRHRVGVSAALLIVLTLVAGAAGTTVGLLRAIRAENNARQEAQRATREADTADYVTDFVVKLFQVPSPDQARGSTITAREILERGAARIEASSHGESWVRARLMETIGRVYLNLGLFDDAETLLRRALAARLVTHGRIHLAVAASFDSLGDLSKEIGESSRALEYYTRSLHIRRLLFRPGHQDIAVSLNNVAVALNQLGRYTEAQHFQEQALAIQENRLTPNDLQLAASHLNLGIVAANLDDRQRARSHYERALEIFAAADPGHPDRVLVLDGLGELYAKDHDYPKARACFEQGLAIRRRVYGEDHPDVAISFVNFGTFLVETGDYAAARTPLERALRIYAKAGLPDHVHAAYAHALLSALLVETGEFAASERHLGQATRQLARIFGADSSEIATLLEDRAERLTRKGRRREAERAAAEARRIRSKPTS